MYISLTQEPSEKGARVTQTTALGLLLIEWQRAQVQGMLIEGLIMKVKCGAVENPSPNLDEKKQQKIA